MQSELDPFSISLINAGGTAGSRTDRQGGHLSVAQAPPDAFAFQLARGIKRFLPQFHGWHGQIASRHHPLVIHPAPTTQGLQILSENSTPGYWAELVSTIAEVLAAPDREPLLAGVIVVHGTDTMAESIAAVRLAVRELNVPIVFVGANVPLLDDRHAIEGGMMAGCRSDIWANIFTAIAYCALSRMALAPQVLLSFGHSIHYPINLRKVHHRAYPRVVASHETDIRRLSSAFRGSPEPYVFENILPCGNCMLRSIDGHLAFNTEHFVRPQRVGSSYIRAEYPSSFIDGAYRRTERTVQHLPASVASASIQVDERTRAVLAETFKSGTVPTIVAHRFTDTLRECAARDIPVFLVGDYGIELGLTYEVDDKTLPLEGVFRISQLIPETALPLLYLSCQQCEDTVWDVGRTARERGLAVAEQMLTLIARVDEGWSPFGVDARPQVRTYLED